MFGAGCPVSGEKRPKTGDRRPKWIRVQYRYSGHFEGGTASPDFSGNEKSQTYEDVPGFCKSATLSEIEANDYVLTPGRYVGVAEEEDDGIHFEDKMAELTATLKEQLAKAQELDQAILENLKVLGYEWVGRNKHR